MINNNVGLPKDLKKYVLKKVLKRVIPCAVLVVIFGVLIILWGDFIFPTKNQGFKFSCYFLVMLLPFALTGVPFKLLDKTYAGTVEEVEMVDTIDSDDSFVKAYRESLYWKSTIKLTIRTENNKTIERKATAMEAKHQQGLTLYNKGDKVFHLYGTNVVVKLPRETDSYVMCSVCGNVNAINNVSCCNCNHTLIKTK